MSILSDANPIKEEFKNKRKQKMQESRTNCFNVVKMLMERHMAPIIAFSFSKKECEVYAIQMAKLDFSTREFFHFLHSSCTIKQAPIVSLVPIYSSILTLNFDTTLVM